MHASVPMKEAKSQAMSASGVAPHQLSTVLSVAVLACNGASSTPGGSTRKPPRG